MNSQEREGHRDRERGDKAPRSESEERKRRERRKEREDRHRREKEKIRGGGRSKKPQGLDIIDKLDVTGIYGQGRECTDHNPDIPITDSKTVFHHDGPFDACNPHRNVKKDRRAPMEAFPANSANMALGGSGPLNSQIDLDSMAVAKRPLTHSPPQHARSTPTSSIPPDEAITFMAPSLPVSAHQHSSTVPRPVDAT
jgi:hypothetical protein